MKRQERRQAYRKFFQELAGLLKRHDVALSASEAVCGGGEETPVVELSFSDGVFLMDLPDDFRDGCHSFCSTKDGSVIRIPPDRPVDAFMDRLDELRSMCAEAGWYEPGTGDPIDEEILDWTADVFGRRYDFDGMPMIHAYPVPDGGGLNLEWDVGRWSASVEISRNSEKSPRYLCEFYALEKGVYDDRQGEVERVLDLEGDYGWGWLDGWIRAATASAGRRDDTGDEEPEEDTRWTP